MKLAVLVYIIFAGFINNQVDSSCPDLKVETNISSSGVSDLLTVEVEVSGGKSPYTYFFTDKKGAPKSFNPKLNVFKNFNRDQELWCSVVDANGCVEKFKIEVE